MGNAKSKTKLILRGRGEEAAGRQASPDTAKVQDPIYDDVELLMIRRAIVRDPEMFVLNNLMMCVQFFGNYEEEIEHVKKSLASSREAEFNKQLPAQKHILLPDVLQEHVAHNVGFTSTRQTFRPTIEPLQPVRIYVVHDNVDVIKDNYSLHYSSVNDAVTYSTLLKPTEHQGYVQLQLVEESPSLKTTLKEEEVDLSSIAEGDDEYLSDGESVYGPKPSSDIVQGRAKADTSLRKDVHTRSLPNLRNMKSPYEEQRTLSRDSIYESGHDMKIESDYENGSSAEEQRSSPKRIWFRKANGGTGEHRGGHRAHLQAAKGNCFPGNSRASSTSSGYRSENYAVDSDSNCSRSCEALQSRDAGHHYDTDRSSNLSNAQRSLHSDESYAYKMYDYSNAQIPRRCFKKVTFTSDGKIYDPREEKKQLLNSKQRRIRLAMKRHNYDLSFISSNEFMQYFENIFVRQLAAPLGFDREAVDDVKREGCVVYCDKVMVSKSHRHSKVEQYEVIPTVWSQWPECAQEWLERPRGTWLSVEDVEKIKDFGCYVVPEGFMPKKGNNLIHDVEWQLIFPAAERYLETCMTPAQVQVYLITLMLHKTFMRPVFDTMFGLTTSHIRNKLCWLIEEDYRTSKWMVNRSGECLMKLLNSLYQNISQNDPTLPDYFVRDRNLFEKVPHEHLLHTQKQLKRIIENPVMYVFHAMENIRHSEKFFPRLDYEMLLKILTIDVVALNHSPAPGYIIRSVPRAQEDDYTINEDVDDRYHRTAGFWENAKSQNRQRKIYGRHVTNKTLINPRKATDSIIEISIRCADLEGPRLSALLDFFVRHFIKMGERCHQYAAYRQRDVFLNQAERLSVLLSEQPLYKEDGRIYRDKIKVLKRKITISKSSDEPPKTPKRNPETPIFTASMNDRFSSDPLKKPTASEQNSKSQSEEQKEKSPRIEKTVKATLHEVRFENIHESKTATLEEERPYASNETASNQKQAGNDDSTMMREKVTEARPEKCQRVVSLVENEQDSFLTETTYI
ncbi:hypothetical protein KM043_008198 [Ampulex compressa]|nr:hypothetical protein KM043_008198 [Ampulex compressa]